MRLIKPRNLTPGPSGPKQGVSNTKTTGGSVSGSWASKILKPLVLTIIIAAVAGSVYWFFVKDDANDQANNASTAEDAKYPDPSEVSIGLYKDSDDPEDMRVIVNSYANVKNYEAALDTARELANKTNEAQDYLTLLWLCVEYEVPGKEACIDEAVAALEPKIKSLGLYDAYSGGKMLEAANRNQIAVDFFQQAYDKYDAKIADETIPTKEELKNLIDELRS